MIEVFKTNVRTEKQASKILTQLSILYPSAKINFDLEDCDKVLRIEGVQIDVEQLIQLLLKKGFFAEILI